MASFDDIENTDIQTNYDKELSMSERFAQAQKSVDWGGHPSFSFDDANKASRNPVNRVYEAEDLKNITSGVGTIAWDSFRKGVLDLQSIGDKAEMALGNTLAGISGNTLGTEMRDRAADSLMKTMEESRFIDSNYGDAETWTSRFVGGAMSMGEMLAVGAATGGAGLGAYVGTLSLSDGALNDMAKYQEEHGSLEGYETDPKNLALDYANAVFQIATEEVGGAGRLLNGRVLKAGKTGTAVVKEALVNFLQESAQGAATDLTEVLKGNQDIDILLENAVGYAKDGVVAGVLGGAIGGTSYKLNKNRAIQNLNEINRKLHPDKNEQEIKQISEDVFAKTEEKMEKSFVPELIAQTEAINDKGKIRDNIQGKVAAMYEDADMSEKQKAKTVEATTTLELENMLYDSIERKIPLTQHPLLKGEVNELGWFREGIPEHRRAEIESLRQQYVGLRDSLKAENESADKNYQKIEELETKMDLFKKDIAKKLADMAVADKQTIQDMIDEQRKIVRESQAKKQMLAAAQQRAEKAVKAQEKSETALAERMATGAEKAKEQRVKKETAQQTKEAKVRSLQEQRDIARTIKSIKLSTAKDAKNIYLQSRIQSDAEILETQRKFARNYFDGFIEDIEENGLSNFKKEDGVYKQITKSYPPIEINDKKGETAAYDPEKNIISISIKNLKNMSEAEIADFIKNRRDEIAAYFQHEYKHFYDIAKGATVSNIEQLLMRISRGIYFNNKLEADAFMQEILSQMANQFNSLSLQEKQDFLSQGRDNYINTTYRVLARMKQAIKSWNKKNTELFKKRLGEQYDMFKESPDRTFYQNKVSGAAPSTYRGAYIPQYRFIQATENMDASTLNHELAHDWGQEYFRWARSGRASESFLRSWGAVEKAIGITDKDTYFTYDASEKFARAYEGWLLQRKDWADILKIDTPDERKAVEEMMEDYRQELVDIYDSLLESSKYFKETFGEVGELKPELVEFFERANRYDDIELRQKRGEITEEQATDEKLNHLVETAVNGQAEQADVGAIEEMEDLRKAENDTERFETEGGNKKALQTRLDRIALAKDLAANDEAMGRYDSHRDMLAVAEQADEFVKNRRDDALAIINGEMAEQDGLYASDLYTALERIANATGDIDLIDELRHSKIANEMAKELGQRVAGFRNYKGSGDVDVMSTLKSVEKQLNKGYTDSMKALAREDVESLIAELKIADNSAELDKFFDEMECK